MHILYLLNRERGQRKQIITLKRSNCQESSLKTPRSGVHHRDQERAPNWERMGNGPNWEWEVANSTKKELNSIKRDFKKQPGLPQTSNKKPHSITTSNVYKNSNTNTPLIPQFEANWEQWRKKQTLSMCDLLFMSLIRQIIFSWMHFSSWGTIKGNSDQSNSKARTQRSSDNDNKWSAKTHFSGISLQTLLWYAAPFQFTR